MHGYVAEVRVPGKHKWHPIAVAAIDEKLSADAIGALKKRFPMLERYEVRMRAFVRIPSIHIVSDDGSGSPENCIPVIKMESQCECCDPGCPTHHGIPGCTEPGKVILYRVDFNDQTGILFCEHCAEDALRTNFFTEEKPNGE